MKALGLLGCLRKALRICMSGLLVWQISAVAAPQVNWGEMVTRSSSAAQRGNLEVDLRPLWQEIHINQVKETNAEALDPQKIWQWPDQRFMPGSTEPRRIQSGERLVARFTVFSEKVGTDFSLSFVKPRLDAVHVSYRYDNGPWTTLAAGDTLPMDRWPLTDRHPSFHLPLMAGQMDMVIQIAHRGVLEAPVMLQNSRAFLESRTSHVWFAGLYVGVNLVLALMGFLMTLNFQRTGFLGVTVMSTMVALLMSFGSGLAGMYIGTGSSTFNDEAKFVITTSWSLVLPWVAGLALGIRSYSKTWWWGAVMCALIGLGLAFPLSDYGIRDTAPRSIPLILLVTCSYTLAMLAWSWFKAYSRNLAIVAGVALYVVSLLMPFIAYVGLISTDSGGHWAAFISMLAALALIRGLFLQHRMGRQVMARVNISPQRDVLTGLLSRLGAQSFLNRIRGRLQHEQTCAVFIYISAMDADAAVLTHGEEGFEMGMVQIAASLSSSVSGVDSLARISRHAFGITVMMPPDPALATRLAQKILSRLMALATHGTPLAGSVRMAMAWLPLYGFKVDALERRCVRTLQSLDDAKRIGWVGGNASHSEASQLLRDARHAYSTPSAAADADAVESLPLRDGAASSTLYERIHRIEREMLHGVDTRFLQADADRMSRLAAASEAKNATSPSSTMHSMPTQQMTTRPPDAAKSER